MRAVRLEEFGSPAVLIPVELPDLEPGPDEVVVRVDYASITFVETQVRAGRPPNPAMSPELPVVLGNGVGGIVDAVGPGVDTALVGMRVVTTTGGRNGDAELCVVPADGLVGVPAGVPTDTATALLADGRTALYLTDGAAPQPGETVLVEAAAGGVGSLLVQLAVAAGARVVAAAGGARKLAVARDLGADVTVDYTDTDWAETVRREVGAVHLVYDGVGGRIGTEAYGLLGEGGRYAAFGMAGGSWADVPDGSERGITRVPFTGVSAEQAAALTRRALDLAAQGALRPVIGQRFTLERAADAHAAIESRATIGKTLLVVNGNDPGSRGGVSA